MIGAIPIALLLIGLSARATGAIGQAASGPTTVSASPSPATAAIHLAPITERAIRARAAAWWTARERRDHQRMYALYEPAYRRKVPFADFLKESAVRTRFDLGDIRVDGIIPEAADRVRVKVNMETRPPRLPAGRVTAEDIWVRVSGQWYKVHEDVRLPFPGNR